MALARSRSVALVGVTAHVLKVEVDVGNGLPGFTLSALSDSVFKQLEHRVRTAISNSGESWPNRRTVVSLSPAMVPKHGSAFDLVIAVTLLVACEALPATAVEDLVVLGELTLDGSVRGVPGVLPAVIGGYRAGLRRFVVPRANAGEAALVAGADIYAVDSLFELCAWLRGDLTLDPVRDPGPSGDPYLAPDLADVIGQDRGRRAVEIAAVGRHHLLMTGPPGVGKTMLAERLPGLLPDLDEEAAMEVTGLHSVAGRLQPGRPLITRPPFVAPHHTASFAAIVGGGAGIAAPGAISLAHRGVLFLDEAPEFDLRVLESLRQPLESGQVTLARAKGIADYPARFQLVLAANPCGCAGGADGTTGRACECTADKLRRYKSRLSGPFRDRIDVLVELDPVSPTVLDDNVCSESSDIVRERVAAARERATARLAGTPWRAMADVPGPVLRGRWRLPSALLAPIRRDVSRGTLSTRGIDRTLKVAWTIADLAGRDRPGADEIDEALALRHGTRVSRPLATPA